MKVLVVDKCRFKEDKCKFKARIRIWQITEDKWLKKLQV